MPNFTIANVLASARDKLGDNSSVAAGRVVSDSELLGFLQSALLEFRQISRNHFTAYYTRRDLFLLISPNIGLYPIDAYGILPDVSLIDEVWERKVEMSESLTNTTIITGDVVTITTSGNHGRSIGDQIQIVNSGFKWLNGLHTVLLVPGATQMTLAGVRSLTAAGAETNAGAYVLYSIGAWNRVGVSSRHLTSDAPLENIPLITLDDGGIRINPVTNERVLRLRTFVGIEAIPATTDTLIFPESQEYLALKIAILGHMAKGGNPDRIQALRDELYGPGGDAANIVGGAAKLLIRGIVLQAQQVRNIRPRFRPPRQVSTPAYIKF